MKQSLGGLIAALGRGGERRRDDQLRTLQRMAKEVGRGE